MGGGLDVYTDGSKLDQDTGWGFWIADPGGNPLSVGGSLGPETSVFQAEITAISKAAEMLLAEGPDTGWVNWECSEVNLWVDSQAALLALDQNFCNSKTVEACVQTLNRLGENRRVVLHWVKAHVGHMGNEVVDEIAKSGARNELQGISEIPVPNSHLRSKLRQGLMVEWTKIWKNLDQARQTKKWFPEPDLGMSSKLFTLDRYAFGQMVQVITGHNYLNYHQNNLGRVSSPLCRYCQEANEESWHIIKECPAFALSRGEAFNVPGNISSTGLLRVPSLLRKATIGYLFSPDGVEQMGESDGNLSQGGSQAEPGSPN